MKLDKKIIIFDFEVFKYDTLLGVIFIDLETEYQEKWQSWNIDEIKQFYQAFKNDIWVGHNNKYYDNKILEAVIYDKNPYEKSQEIINGDYMSFGNNYGKNVVDYFDTMQHGINTSLKITEAFWGKRIDILDEVSFDIDRPLTHQERQKVELYNVSDLNQTRDNFFQLLPKFKLLLRLKEHFNLDYSILYESFSNISAKCLKVKKQYNLPKLEKPYIFENLKIENYPEVLNWYKNFDYRNDKKIITINGVEHQLGIGGIHGARNVWYSKEMKQLHKHDLDNYNTTSDENYDILYLDVAGYYNLLMINFDLFSRSMSDEAKENYKTLYHEQLRLKKTDPALRQVYKIVLLAVFGATFNAHTEFFDKDHYEMVVLNGQLFLIDLLEKLDNYMFLIQSNTDGIIIKTHKKDFEIVSQIVKEWQERTGFVLKFEKVNKIIQKDVNNYYLEKADGEVVVKGEALKYVNTFDNPHADGNGAYTPKLPMVISLMLKDAFSSGETPEQSIEKYKDNLRLFQFIVKKDTYKQLELHTEKDPQEVNNGHNDDNISITILPNVVRAFASNDVKLNTIYKFSPDKKNKRMKVASLPLNVFIYNNEILSAESKNEIYKKINWSWYINKTWERLDEFLGDKSLEIKKKKPRKKVNKVDE